MPAGPRFPYGDSTNSSNWVYARAFVSIADFGAGKHVNCDVGFEFDGF